MLPCITHVHVKVDCDHQPTLGIVNTAPARWCVWHCHLYLICVTTQVSATWNLLSLVDFEQHVHQFMRAVQIDNTVLA